MKALQIQGLLLLVIGLSTMNATAQRTVTNADLEKYRQARIQADEDYRKNYERLGLPSPEELEKRTDEKLKRFSEFSRELRERRQQDEYLEQLRAIAAANSQPQVVYLGSQRGYQINPFGYYQFGYAPFPVRRSHSYFDSRPTFGPNVQMVRDQASMFPGAVDMIRENSRARSPRRVFAPR
jgi:hypothetical protein